MIRITPFRIYNETRKELFYQSDLERPFEYLNKSLKNGDCVYWMDYIEDDKNGKPLFAGDLVSIHRKPHLAIYDEYWDGNLIWYDPVYVQSEAFVPFAYSVEYAKAEYINSNLKEYDSLPSLPEFKVIDLVNKKEINEEYMGKSFDDKLLEVLYCRKITINEHAGKLTEWDVIKFDGTDVDEAYSGYALVIPNFPLYPLVLPTIELSSFELEFFMENVKFETVGNLYLIDENIKKYILQKIKEYYGIVIPDPLESEWFKAKMSSLIDLLFFNEFKE
ncbi:hypothetical protein P9D43_20365 [Neobacillus niacini]|uniref:hypothetical protein n=1 Tax=Neobacillus niacini TaxID=86668 RepID=UPI000B131365|nr:hypothetical protein [Neobacillus niacini]MEC1524358.1 hypothetical protein [Neobacillus niacini]